MGSTWGEAIRVSIFGESHGGGVGVVIDNPPAGEALDWDAVLVQMARRAPGRDRSSTPRKETDLPEILSYELVTDRVPYDGLYYFRGEMLVPEWEETIEQLQEELYGTEEQPAR